MSGLTVRQEDIFIRWKTTANSATCSTGKSYRINVRVIDVR